MTNERLNGLLVRMMRLRFIGPPALRLLAWVQQSNFRDSRSYWERRYQRGGTSGEGSFGDYAKFKAEVVNRFIREHRISSITEFGCGDGNQLALMEYPSYLGLDISPSAIELCRQRFAADTTKRFMLYEPMRSTLSDKTLCADATVSLDVIYHLVEDVVYEKYLDNLFEAARQYVIIFSSNTDFNPPYAGPHVKHRRFSDAVDHRLPEWRLLETVPGAIGDSRTSGLTATAANFYIYRKHHEGTGHDKAPTNDRH